jgi:hypothetical protein
VRINKEFPDFNNCRSGLKNWQSPVQLVIRQCANYTAAAKVRKENLKETENRNESWVNVTHKSGGVSVAAWTACCV